ncbi:MAG: DUF1464 family protein [Archaeoglobaceae archaeon]
MVKVLGIDPGTKTMDLCGLDDGKVVFERSLDSAEVAKNPEVLLESIDEFGRVDLIAGPSGYGVELTKLESIPLEFLEDWYYTYILLTSKKSIEKAISMGFIGAFLYKAMTMTILEMKKAELPVVFIPGVINLTTVPEFRKLNKADMGTADKMCVAVLGVYDQSRKLGIPYSDTSFIHVEMGFGYNSVIGVENGRIVDGFGGTTMLGPGFLTMGYADQELIQLAENWEKADIFVGGCISVSSKQTLEEFVEAVDKDEKAKLAWDAMFDGIEKAVAAIQVSVRSPKEILLSGRLVRMKEIYEELQKRLSKFGRVRKVEGLEGAKITKETAQGYAIVADGIAGGKFKDLIDWMKIKDARGTAMDYFYHPKVAKIKERIIKFRF